MPSASPTSSPSPSPSATRSGLPHACKRHLTAWLSEGGKSRLHAIHNDLSNYGTDVGVVVKDVLNGGNTAASVGTWQADLSVFQEDASGLQDNPAPSCGGGVQLSRAASDWLKAVTAYQSAAQILLSSPNLTGVSESDSDMNAGNKDLSHARAALKRTASESRHLITNIAKGTGT